MTDREELEQRLRTMLATRADDVEATPALWERVERGRRRASRTGWALGAVAVTAALVGALVVVPQLGPDDTTPEVIDTPEGTPSDVELEDVGPTEPVVLGGVAYGTVSASTTTVSLLTAAGGVAGNSSEQWDVRAVAAAVGSGGEVFPFLVEELDTTRIRVSTGRSLDLQSAAPNGDGMAVSPDGTVVAWLQGAELHVSAVGESGSAAVTPLEGVPGDLVLQDWTVDGRLVATGQDGVWTAVAPAEAAFELVPGTQGARDAIATDDGLLLLVDGALRRPGSDTTFGLPASFGDDVELTPARDGAFAALDRASGQAVLVSTATPDLQVPVPSDVPLVALAVVGAADPGDGRAGGDEAPAFTAEVAPLVWAHAPTGQRVVDLHGPDGTVVRSDDVPDDVVSLAADPTWTSGDGVVGLVLGEQADAVGLLDMSLPSPDGLAWTMPAAPNGGRVVVSPDGEALAWMEGGDLHVVPVSSGPQGLRVQPVEGGDGLVLQQWVSQADAALLLATRPDGGAWRVPMDVSNVFNTGPVGPAEPLGDDVLDIATGPDLRTYEVVPAGPDDILLRVEDGEPSTVVVRVGSRAFDVAAGTTSIELLGPDAAGRLLVRTDGGVLALFLATSTSGPGAAIDGATTIGVARGAGPAVPLAFAGTGDPQLDEAGSP